MNWCGTRSTSSSSDDVAKRRVACVVTRHSRMLPLRSAFFLDASLYLDADSGGDIVAKTDLAEGVIEAKTARAEGVIAAKMTERSETTERQRRGGETRDARENIKFYLL